MHSSSAKNRINLIESIEYRICTKFQHRLKDYELQAELDLGIRYDGEQIQISTDV